MVGSKLFVNLIWRFLLLILTCLAVAYTAFRMLDGENIFTLVTGLLLVFIQIYFLGKYILRIHRVLVTFVDSVGADMASELRFRERHPYLGALESRLNDLKAAISLSRMEERKQKVLLHMVVDSMDPGLICINREGAVIFMNKPARNLFQNQPVQDLGDIRAHHPKLAGAIDIECGRSHHVVALPGFKASVRCNSFLLGKGDYFLYSIQNIQKEVDASETESWQKLIRILTHEIMNSLGPILSLSKSLKKSVDDRRKLEEGLNTIESTGEGLIHFITEYRKLSTLPSPKKEAIPLYILFRHIESLFLEECKSRGVELIVNAGDGDLILEADRHQVEQILVNLIRNAMESLNNIDCGRVELTAERETGNLLIQVTDNGPGISDEIADKIFVPFYSTKAGGSGIGLSLSRQIMHKHGGLLAYKSTPGERTTFSIRFPV